MGRRGGDPLDLGLIGLSQFLPFVLLILPADEAPADRAARACDQFEQLRARAFDRVGRDRIARRGVDRPQVEAACEFVNSSKFRRAMTSRFSFTNFFSQGQASINFSCEMVTVSRSPCSDVVIRRASASF